MIEIEGGLAISQVDNPKIHSVQFLVPWHSSHGRLIEAHACHDCCRELLVHDVHRLVRRQAQLEEARVRGRVAIRLSLDDHLQGTGQPQPTRRELEQERAL